MLLLSRQELTDLFNQGRFKNEPTLVFESLDYQTGCPPEFIIEDTKGKELGACWQRTIEDVLSYAAEMGDTRKTNANLLSFQWAAKEMKDFRENGIEKIERAERHYHDTKVVAFPFSPPENI